MQTAQVAPLTEAIPPKLYGGTERVISWLADELVALGHEASAYDLRPPPARSEAAANSGASARLPRDSNA